MNVKRKIPFFNYSHIFHENDKAYSKVLTETCQRGAYIMQQELTNFEQALQDYLGVKYAIGTSDGTMALLLYSINTQSYPASRTKPLTLNVLTAFLISPFSSITFMLLLHTYPVETGSSGYLGAICS